MFLANEALYKTTGSLAERIRRQNYVSKWSAVDQSLTQRCVIDRLMTTRDVTVHTLRRRIQFQALN